MDLKAAVDKHAEWKIKFRTAIARQEIMDSDTISKDNCCELGRWLHGEAKAMHGNAASYPDCVGRHAAFHVEAGKVARKINARLYTEAESMIGNGTLYASASRAVGVAISRLKMEAGL